jgi:probable phosphoglycerate mutase
VYLVRHGEVQGAETRRFIGHLDVPLSASGERQVQAVARRLSSVKLDAVYTSDLSRTRHTADILAAPHSLVPRLRPALREFAMGRWEGLTAAQIREREPEAFTTWMADVAGYRFPEGESLGDLTSRAWPTFEAIVEAHAGETVAMVAHGGTNRMILCRLLGLPATRLLAIGQDYGALTLLVREGDRWALAFLNETGPGRPAGPG